jgi:hypothetical protein
VNICDLPEFAETTLKNIERTGILLTGNQNNKLQRMHHVQLTEPQQSPAYNQQHTLLHLWWFYSLVNICDLPEFAETTLKNIERTGILLTGNQNNKYGFTIDGTATITSLQPATHSFTFVVILFIIALPERLNPYLLFWFPVSNIPALEDNMIVHIIPDNFGSLKLRKKMRENNCNKTVVIGGWSSAPYGARIVKEGGVLTPEDVVL